jgi:hypothetical protein
MSALTNADFKKILKYYKLKIPRSKKKTRKKSVDVLAGKLCRCIKKVGKKNNKRTKKKYKRKASTAICTSSIFKKRGLIHSRFTCKKKSKLYINKKNKRYLSKTRKKFNMKYN